MMKRKTGFLVLSLVVALSWMGNPTWGLPLQVGDSIPALPKCPSIHSIEGLAVSFVPPQGKILLVCFWDTNSWRADQTAAWGLDLYRRFHNQGLEMLGVCTDSLEEEVMEFSVRWLLPWPQIANSEFSEFKLTEHFGIRTLPANFLIDPAGKILAMNLQEEEGSSQIARLIGCTEDMASPMEKPSVSLSKRDWGAEQATGEPDTHEAGDFATAWASKTPDAQPEWLTLRYEDALQPRAIQIYESQCPGAVDRICSILPDGSESEIWRGEDPTPATASRGISSIPLQCSEPIQIIKVYLDSPNHPGCNEIDAVGLVDESGTIHWAVDAQSSSSFAETIQFDSTAKGYVFPTERSLVSFQQLEGHDQAIADLKKSSGNTENPKTDSFRYHLKAFIDGTSVLAIHRDTARWYHPAPVLDGLTSENQYPTYINGTEWFPTWSNQTKTGWSSIQANLSPALPTQAIQVSLKNPQVQSSNCGSEMNDKTFGFSGMIGQAPKGAIYILQQPTAENDFVLAIAFDDFGLGGTNMYDCFINVRIADREISNSLAQSAFLPSIAQ